MLKEKSIIQICIVAVILLLPLAHLKVIFFGMPLYSVEMPIVAALLIYGYGWYRGEFSPMRKINFCDPFVIGIILFFLGAVISFVANPFSLTGLGMLRCGLSFLFSSYGCGLRPSRQREIWIAYSSSGWES